ncbi:hypothetical protein CAEBREN_11529 [Caenorhabditis brenneri]|uniref:Uncharacterized protein n=1 Tax=Caenorhabditis brenneri TaxID=135651 RepID=G0NKY7_CAEBE|nr:hypothetical protein CAEBREN_11529 [Caenorhabditis brenneri]
MDEPFLRDSYLNRFVFWTGAFVIVQFSELLSIVVIDFEDLMVDNTTCPEYPDFFNEIQSCDNMRTIVTILSLINLVLAACILTKLALKGRYFRRFPVTQLSLLTTAMAMCHVCIVIVVAIHIDDVIDLVFFANNYLKCFNHEAPTFGRTTLQILFTISMMLCCASTGMMYYYLKWFADHSPYRNISRSEMSNILESMIVNFQERVRAPSLPPSYEESTRFYEVNRITLNQHHAIARYLAESNEEIEMSSDIESMATESLNDIYEIEISADIGNIAAEPLNDIHEIVHNPNLISNDDVNISHLGTTVDEVQNEFENRVEEIVDAIQDTRIEKSDDGNSNESEPAFDVNNLFDDDWETDGGNRAEN